MLEVFQGYQGDWEQLNPLVEKLSKALVHIKISNEKVICPPFEIFKDFMKKELLDNKQKFLHFKNQ